MVDGDNIIGNHYQIQHKLGEGGMGAVYQGIDTRSGETVAIKQLKPDMTTAEMLERFKREGEALRELNHPNIVKMLDAFEVDDNHYLVMEYVSGGDLRQLLESQSKLDLQQCLNIAIDLADALTRAHRLDIIHRDLKPENVLIADDGTVRLTDFGVARLGQLERVTDTDATVGTIDYLAPEALSDEAIDERADIWAFGIILCEMLTGENPFRRMQFIDTITAIAIEPLPDLEMLAQDAPIALIDLIYRMLEKDHHARIASVRHVGAELEDLLHGRVNAPPETRFKAETPTYQLRKHHNLPIQATEFVGREAELKELDKLLLDNKIRLITILAPGGMGKTRLALESAHRYLEQFKDGVYFVDLTPLSDSTNIMQTIIDSIGLPASKDGRTPKQQLLDFLSNKSILLVIDNWEHIIEGASIVSEMLQIAPDLQIVATSRLRLNQSGETLFHLSGMEFPDWETPEDALNYAAVKLFMSSAKRALPNFELTAENLDYVARICRLVGGMPLGIVLAASWVSLLSPQEIADEIANGIEFLESAGGDVPERQRSIQAVFDYSWQMLGADEQDIYMKLSIFKGSFSRQAAQQVTGASLRQLMNLLNQSLLQRDISTGRYSIHELARQYAYAKLENSDELDAIRSAHMCYYANALENLLPDLKGSRMVEAMDNIEFDIENVFTAWHTAFESQQWHVLEQMVVPLWWVNVRTRLNDIAERFMAVIDHLQSMKTTDDDAQKLLVILISMMGLMDHYREFTPDDREQLATVGVKLARELGDQKHLALCMAGLSFAVSIQGRNEEAFEINKQSLNILRQLDEPYWLARSLLYHCYVSAVLGDIDAPKRCAEESLAIGREIGNQGIIGIALGNLAVSYEILNELDRAKQLTEQSIAIYREAGDLFGLLHQLGNLSTHYVNQLELEKLTKITTEIELLARETNSARGYSIFHTLQTVPYVLAEHYEEALILQEKTLSFARKKGNQSALINYIILYANLLLLSGNFHEGLSQLKAVLKPEILPLYQPDLLELCNGLVRLLHDYDAHVRGVELLALIYTHSHSTPYIRQNPTALRIKAELENALDSDVYQQAWQRGEALDLGETVMSIVDEYLPKVSE